MSVLHIRCRLHKWPTYHGSLSSNCVTQKRVKKASSRNVPKIVATITLEEELDLNRKKDGRVYLSQKVDAFVSDGRSKPKFHSKGKDLSFDSRFHRNSFLWLAVRRGEKTEYYEVYFGLTDGFSLRKLKTKPAVFASYLPFPSVA